MSKRLPDPLRERIQAALLNEEQRACRKRVLADFRSRREERFADAAEFARLRAMAREIKRRALHMLPDLLQQFEENAAKNGIMVHWAETAGEANEIIWTLIRKHGGKKIIKGKSMVSEETGLNINLTAKGARPVETETGEFIRQLCNEPPAHVVSSICHKSRQDVGRLFEKKLNSPYTDDIDRLCQSAQKVLRGHFREADIGISGVNFAVASSGALVLVENEGNVRMSSTLPDMHIALMSLEKVIPDFSDLPPLLLLLSGSATGQRAPAYVSVIRGPRGAQEKDGPRQVHLVILDNGRSRILADRELRQALQCIRCGACMNYCPVFGRIGGQAYGSPYPGPIGSVLWPQIQGLHRRGDLPFLSTLCGACAEACPAGIPLQSLLERLRDEAHTSQGVVRGSGSARRPGESVFWRIWELSHTRPVLNTLTGGILGKFLRFAPRLGSLRAWTICRSKPRFARKNLHQMLRKRRNQK